MVEWASTNVIERAKEELEILETQHPNRFHYLKLELKSLISHFESNSHGLILRDTLHVLPASSSATTQESSTGKKRKKDCAKEMQKAEVNKHKFRKVGSEGCKKSKDKIDSVLERAQQCLQKIRLFKISLS